MISNHEHYINQFINQSILIIIIIITIVIIIIITTIIIVVIIIIYYHLWYHVETKYICIYSRLNEIFSSLVPNIGESSNN